MSPSTVSKLFVVLLLSGVAVPARATAGSLLVVVRVLEHLPTEHGRSRPRVVGRRGSTCQ